MCMYFYIYCVLWDAHLMKKCVLSKICAYFKQDESISDSNDQKANINISFTIICFFTPWGKQLRYTFMQ